MILSIAAYAQDSSSYKKNSLVAGAWAMQFQISSNFQVASFQGTAISIKHHSTKSSAFRLGVDFGSINSSEDYTSKALSNDSITDEGLRDYDRYILNIRSQYIYYPSPNADINLFFGIGPQIIYSWRNTNESSTKVMANSLKENSVGIGISGTAGVECFATKSISFHSEYNLLFSYNIYQYQRWTSRELSETTRKYYEWTSMGVRFGVSAYF
jgi:hypothetical protein